MKQNSIFKLIGSLLLICGISALVLGFVNSKTAPLIAERKAEEFKAAYGEVYPEAKDFKDFPDEKNYLNDNITKIVEVKDGDKTVGYVIGGLGTGGYGGDIEFMMGVDLSGKVHGFKVTSHKETDNFGSVVEEKPFHDSVVGKVFNMGIIATAEHSGDNEVMAMSGATYTTDAMVKGFNAVAVLMGQLSDEIGEVDPSAVEKPKVEIASPKKEELLKAQDGAKEVKTIDEESFKNEIVVNAYEISSGGDKTLAIQANPKGFGGNINYVLAFKDGVVTDFITVQAGETPGYGAEIEEDGYKKSVIGKKVEELESIDAISGATITSDAMAEGYKAIKEAYSVISDMDYKTAEFVEKAADPKDDSKSSATAPSGDKQNNSESSSKNPEDMAKAMFEGATAVETKDLVYTVKKDDKVLGHAILGKSSAGFGGDIQALFGIDSTGKVVGFEIVEENETAGFGAVIGDEDYKKSVIGKGVKDLESVDAISGATVTSDAMAEIFKSVIELYKGL